MLRRLFVGFAIVAAVAGLAPAIQNQPVASASPANEIIGVQFAYTVTPGAEIVFQAENNYFSRNSHIIWAVVDFTNFAPGTRLNYVLRLNGNDYKNGYMACCENLTQGRLAYPLYRRDNPDRTIPGGRYDLLIFDGDKLVGQGSFGVRGGSGSDNEDPEPTGSTSSGGSNNQPGTESSPGLPGESPVSAPPVSAPSVPSNPPQNCITLPNRPPLCF